MRMWNDKWFEKSDRLPLGQQDLCLHIINELENQKLWYQDPQSCQRLGLPVTHEQGQPALVPRAQRVYVIRT